jgi:hypothetical protein
VVIDEGKCENSGSLSLSLSSTFFASLLIRSFILLAKLLPKKRIQNQKMK